MIKLPHEVIAHSFIYANIAKIEKRFSDDERRLIKSFCIFYDVNSLGEHLSDFDGSELWLEDAHSVDLHIGEILERWGMNWDKVCRLGEVAG